MRVLIDADDTIWDLLDAWVNCLNKKYNISINTTDCDDWDMGKLFPMLTHEQIFEVLNDREFWETVVPIDGAIKTIQKMMDDGIDVVIVTSSYFTTIHSKVECALRKHFSFIPWDNVIICKRKQLIKGDVLVDDYYKNLIGGEYRGILFSAYHNRALDESQYGLIRCTGWDEVYATIKEWRQEIDGRFECV